MALQQLTVHLDKFNNAVIQSVSQTFRPGSLEIKASQDLLQELSKNNKTLVLQWIPGHCSIHGNEQADTLAKKGAFLPLTFPKPIAFHTVKNVIKEHYNTQHLNELT